MNDYINSSFYFTMKPVQNTDQSLLAFRRLLEGFFKAPLKIAFKMVLEPRGFCMLLCMPFKALKKLVKAF